MSADRGGGQHEVTGQSGASRVGTDSPRATSSSLSLGTERAQRAGHLDHWLVGRLPGYYWEEKLL